MYATKMSKDVRKESGLFAVVIACGSLLISVASFSIGEIREKNRSLEVTRREYGAAILLGEEAARLSASLGTRSLIQVGDGKWKRGPTERFNPGYKASVELMDALLESCGIPKFTGRFVQQTGLKPAPSEKDPLLMFISGNYMQTVEALKGTKFTDFFRAAEMIKAQSYSERVTLVRSVEPDVPDTLVTDGAVPDPESWEMLRSRLNPVLRRLGKERIQRSGQAPVFERYRDLLDTYNSIAGDTVLE